MTTMISMQASNSDDFLLNPISLIRLLKILSLFSSIGLSFANFFSILFRINDNFVWGFASI